MLNNQKKIIIIVCLLIMGSTVFGVTEWVTKVLKAKNCLEAILKPESEIISGEAIATLLVSKIKDNNQNDPVLHQRITTIIAFLKDIVQIAAKEEISHEDSEKIQENFIKTTALIGTCLWRIQTQFPSQRRTFNYIVAAISELTKINLGAPKTLTAQ